MQIVFLIFNSEHRSGSKNNQIMFTPITNRTKQQQQQRQQRQHLRKGLSISLNGCAMLTAPATQVVTKTPAPKRLPNTFHLLSSSHEKLDAEEHTNVENCDDDDVDDDDEGAKSFFKIAETQIWYSEYLEVF